MHSLQIYGKIQYDAPYCRLAKTLIYNDFIKEEEASHRASVCMVAYISCLAVANGAEVLEKKVGSGHRNVIPDRCDQCEILTILRYKNIDLSRHEHTRSDKLHECSSDIADLLHTCLEIVAGWNFLEAIGFASE